MFINLFLLKCQVTRPTQYEKYISLARQPVRKLETHTSSSRTRLELTLPLDLTQLPAARRNLVIGAAMGAIAGALNIPSDMVEVLHVQIGSVTLLIEMPAEAALRLLDLYLARDSLIRELGIQQIRVVSKSGLEQALYWVRRVLRMLASGGQLNVLAGVAESPDPRYIELTIADLRDEDHSVRQKAVKKLVEMDNSVVESLIAILQDEDSNVRWGAAVALGHIGSVRAVEPLITALQDANRNVRREAAVALGRIGNNAVEPLTAILQDEDRSVRQEAVRALGEMQEGSWAQKPAQNLLRQFIINHYDQEELRALCFDLDINYDELDGKELNAKARELIERLDHQRRLNEVLVHLRNRASRKASDLLE